MIILTLLGANKYSEVSYNWQGRQAKSHSLIQVALDKWFPESDMLVLATKKANDEHGQMVKALVPKTKIVPIPDGKNTDEYWEIYNRIEQNIPAKADLVLDVTHGFRSLPVLALLAVSFLRAAKSVNVQHVLYGAYEAKSGDTAPVFDLAPFLTMLDWASATDRFLETGDARKFRPLVETKGAKPLNVDLNAGVKELEQLSDALAANRASRSGELAGKTLGKVRAALNSEWEPSHAPLKLLLPRLEQGLGLLARDVEGSQQDQLVQSFGQVSWFLRHRQYEKALGLAREWMVSFAQWKREGTWLPVELEGRERIEDWLRDCEKGKTPAPEGWADFIGLWRNLGHLRNDLLHFGFRDAARGELAIPDEVTEKIMLLRAAVLLLGLKLPEPL